MTTQAKLRNNLGQIGKQLSLNYSFPSTLLAHKDIRIPIKNVCFDYLANEGMLRAIKSAAESLVSKYLPLTCLRITDLL